MLFYLTCRFVVETHVCDIHLKVTEQYFHVVLFNMLYKLVVTLKSVDETLVCDHSMKAIE